MEIKTDGKTLTLTTALTAGTPSKTGKTLVLASSGGFISVPGADGVKINVTVIKTR